MHGVVAGAADCIPLMALAYEIKGALAAGCSERYASGEPADTVASALIWVFGRDFDTSGEACCAAVAGKRLHVTAGVTQARLGCDLLVCVKEIRQLLSEGYRFSVH